MVICAEIQQLGKQLQPVSLKRLLNVALLHEH
jgi:hypothetical protein